MRPVGQRAATAVRHEQYGEGQTYSGIRPSILNNPFGAPSSSYATGLQTSTANTIAESYYVCVNQTVTMISG